MLSELLANEVMIDDSLHAIDIFNLWKVVSLHKDKESRWLKSPAIETE